MNRRKIAAIILIAPLLWFHAVKLFHYHGSNEAKFKIDSELNQISATEKDISVSCIICDYQATKDANLQQVSFDIILPQSFYSYSSSIATFRISSCNFISSDRAPPAFLS